MTCKRGRGGGGFIIQRHNELRDLEAQMLNLVCHDVEVEPVLQEITGQSLARGGGGGLIQPPIPGLTFMHGVFGVDVTGFHIL